MIQLEPHHLNESNNTFISCQYFTQVLLANDVPFWMARISDWKFDAPLFSVKQYERTDKNVQRKINCLSRRKNLLWISLSFCISKTIRNGTKIVLINENDHNFKTIQCKENLRATAELKNATIHNISFAFISIFRVMFSIKANVGKQTIFFCVEMKLPIYHRKCIYLTIFDLMKHSIFIRMIITTNINSRA